MNDKPQQQRILVAATDLLAAGGAEALRVRDIAAAAECSTMGVYSHFGGKDGVVDAIFADGFERFEAALRSRWGGPGARRLHRVGHAYRDWGLANPGAYGVMFAGAVPGFAPSPESLETASSAFQVLIDGVTAEVEAGRFAAREPAEIAWIIWGMVHGMVMLELRSITPPPPAPSAKATFECALDACIRAFS